MKFKANSRRRALEYEKDVLKFWKDNKIFEKSIEQRPESQAYVFYDGPPFITGVPHHGTLLSSIVKDAVPRYQTMRGKRVERRWGWDCHGLPAENFTEKKLGITDRHEIGTTVPLEKYICSCRDNMVQTGNLWEDTIDRIGRWVDFKGAYKTMDKEFMESVWWAFKTLYEKGKIYEGEKVLMYDTKWATPLSKAEVTMDAGAYQDVTDPSVYVKFKIVRDDSHAYFSQKPSSSGTSYTGSPTEPPAKQANLSGTSGIYVADEEGKDSLKNKHFESDSAYLLAWTTTPWTLPANVALAVHPDLDYVEVEHNGEVLIMAKSLVEKVMTDEKHKPLDYKIVGEVKGRDLAGLKYEPLFECDYSNHFSYDTDRNKWESSLVRQGRFRLGKDGRWFLDNVHKVWAADYVADDGGTGIVHIAPAYGEEDFELAQKHGLPVVHKLDDYGKFIDGEWQGMDLWEANKPIAKKILADGKALKIDYIRHEYPHNPRTGERLIYRAHPSWFMDIDGQRSEMLENNKPINWFPEHIKNGRFAKNIEAAPDWNLSRDRFWATAMPVWESNDGDKCVIGSYAELKEFSGMELEDYHRPWIDEVEFDAYVVMLSNGKKMVAPLSDTKAEDVHKKWQAIKKSGNLIPRGPASCEIKHFKRIDKVLDCWFESGSMPFAQFHYPFANKDKFEASFPGDFITEYVGQVRAWFYYVHAVSTALFGKPAFKNVIVTGTVAGNDGRKMSKSYGNYTDPNELMDKFSADSLRFLLLQSPLLNGEDYALIDKDVADVARKLSMIWNMYDFFTMYAEVDNFTFPYSSSSEDAFLVRGMEEGAGTEKLFEIEVKLDKLKNPLDVWIVSRLHELNEQVVENMDKYNLPDALEPILPFIDDASNWYVRRSRRRFWKSEDDGDKNDAYKTLHYVLLKLSVILAPFTPFLSEELYQKMGGGAESVHLLDYPMNFEKNQAVLDEMGIVRFVINEGLRQRAENGFKVRQPLQGAIVRCTNKAVSEYADVIKEELNLKDVMLEIVEVKDGEEFTPTITVSTLITDDLKREGLAREVIRAVQNARKKAGLNVDDRINLVLSTDDKNLKQAIEQFRGEIDQEVLAVGESVSNKAYSELTQIEKIDLNIKLEKAQA